MSDYIIYYTESNLVCLIIFGIMLVHDLCNTARQETQIKYDHALISFMLYFVSDSVWAAVIAGVLPSKPGIVLAVNFANYVIMAAITYLWLRYVMAVEQAPHRERGINKFAVIFPFLISTIALIVVYCAAPRALFTEALRPTLTFDIFQIGVPIINIVAVVFYSMRKARQEENPIEKKKHLFIGLFPLIVICGGLLQVLVLPNTPVFCFASTILMLIFYIRSMETQISLDPLTKLNNRGQLMRYISQKSNLHIEGRQTFVVMIDVNDFKTINDTYGHAEGDRALVLIADNLKKVVNRFSIPCFLGRYGGDEFILIIHPVDAAALEQIIRAIRDELALACQAAETPYVLSVGVGYDALLNEQDTVQKCIQRADHRLYLDKEYCKLHGQSTVCG